MEHDLTRGNVLKTIAVFALPYMLSYFLQMLYGMADLYMMGQFSGAAGITAVGNGAQTLYIITVTLVGLAMGTTVIVGHAINSVGYEDASLRWALSSNVTGDDAEAAAATKAREDYAKMQYYEMFRDGKNVYTEHFQTEANETDPNLAPGTTKIK